ncbi:MAG: glycosyltransferase [Bacteroidales bacterium]|nr:glycosyltransferase [Bacteroidales bacterium]
MISFIVIGKNEGERLQRCLTSVHTVVKQDCIAEWEILYVDSRSCDNSIQIAKESGATVFKITGECNAAIARNIGAKEARGEILFFIDGDMELLPGFLHKVLVNDKLVYPFLSGIFDDIVHDTEWNYLYTTPRHQLKEGDADSFSATTGGLFLITKELWDKVGGMDNRLKRSQDYDLGLRLTKMGYPLCRKAIVAAKHYMVAYTLRCDYVKNMKYTALLLRKHWNNKQYLQIFCKSRYTSLSLLLVLGVVWWWQPIVVLWIILLLYKTLRTKTLSVSTFFRLIACDFSFLGALLCYWPKQPIINYVKVE